MMKRSRSASGARRQVDRVAQRQEPGGHDAVAIVPPAYGIGFVDQVSDDRPNDTGLPDDLKAGVEHLSGLSMDHVRVHFNSSRPAQLGALAYTQGADIHVASGQERHLPHEAWHAVQQAEGRVRPTMQLKGGVQVNDDEELEHEADVMGTKALQMRRADPATGEAQDGSEGEGQVRVPSVPSSTIQRAIGLELECANLEIVRVDSPKPAKKGAIIEGSASDHWKAVYEDTAAGSAVVEFVVEPAVSTEQDLMTSVGKMMDMAEELDGEPTPKLGYDRNGYWVRRAGAIEGALQVTMGVPLENMMALYSDVQQKMTGGGAYRLMKSLERGTEEEYTTTTTTRWGFQKKGFGWNVTKTETRTRILYEKAPDGTPVKDLPAETKGFLVLVWDYLKQSFVPLEAPFGMAEMGRYQEGTGKGLKIPFAKGLFPLMARTDFNAIFDSLSETERNRLSAVNEDTGAREMKDPWVKWIIKTGLGLKDEDLTETFLQDDPLINRYLQNVGSASVGPKRASWLKNMPDTDEIMGGFVHPTNLRRYNFLGLGELGRKADIVSGSGAIAPVFEWRKPEGSSVGYKSWRTLAKKYWDLYDGVVGGQQVTLGPTVPKPPKDT